MKWIKVEDQLPSQGEVVLLYQTWPKDTMFNCRADPLPINFSRLGGLRYDGLFIDYQNQYGEPLKYITHWMPLPNIPEKENEYDKILQNALDEGNKSMSENTWMPLPEKPE